MSQSPIIIVHGGSDIVAGSRLCGRMCGLKDAVRVGYRVLAKENLSAIDAVEAAICKMESDEFFNAGFGSILTEEGIPEMDASIMSGSDLTVGAVANVSVVEHPITLARKIKENSPYSMLSGEGASEFARKNGIPIVAREALITTYALQCLNEFKKHGLKDATTERGGTVGCVAMDKNGNIAAGTSTGGTNGKQKGSIGDSSIIGCGTYADNRLGGVSCTGHGESIIKVVLAHTIASRLPLVSTAVAAAQFGTQKVVDVKGKGVGAICINKEGDVGFHFTTPMMPWAYIKNNEMHFGVKHGEDNLQGPGGRLM